VLNRFHGGVAAIPGSVVHPHRARDSAAARRIARAVASAIPYGSSFILGSGTTMEAVARGLLLHKGLRVLTYDLGVAMILSDKADCELMLAAGVVRSRGRALFGDATVAFMRRFRVDIGLLGIPALEIDGTLRDADCPAAEVA